MSTAPVLITYEVFLANAQEQDIRALALLAQGELAIESEHAIEGRDERVVDHGRSLLKKSEFKKRSPRALMVLEWDRCGCRIWQGTYPLPLANLAGSVDRHDSRSAKSARPRRLLRRS